MIKDTAKTKLLGLSFAKFLIVRGNYNTILFGMWLTLFIWLNIFN